MKESYTQSFARESHKRVRFAKNLSSILRHGSFSALATLIRCAGIFGRYANTSRNAERCTGNAVLHHRRKRLPGDDTVDRTEVWIEDGGWGKKLMQYACYDTALTPRIGKAPIAFSGCVVLKPESSSALRSSTSGCNIRRKAAGIR
jgi:hypothetical protein